MLVIPPLSSVPSEGSRPATSSAGRSGASSGSTTSTVTTATGDAAEKSLRPAVYIKLRDLVDLYQIDISTCVVKDVDSRDREVRDDNSNDVEAIGSRKFETSDKDDGSRQQTPPVSPTSTSNLEAVFGGGATSGNKDRKKLNPTLGGYNLCLLVGQVNIVVDKLRVDRSRVRLAEVLVGDETGTVSLRARDEQIDLLQSVSSDISCNAINSTSCSEASSSCNEGKASAIVLRNCTLELFQNKHLRLAVTKWGKMSKYPDNIASTPSPPPRMNKEWNYSLADLSCLAVPRKGRHKQGEDSSFRHRPSRHSLSPQISPSKSPEMVLSEHGPLSLNNNYPPLPSMQAAEMSPLHSHQLQATLRGQWKHQYPLLSSSTTSLEEETARMSFASVNRSSSRSLGSPRQSWQSHQNQRQQLSQPGHQQQQQRQAWQQTQIGTGIESGYSQTMRRQQSYSSATSSPPQRPPHYLQHPQTMQSYVMPQHYSPQGYNMHQRQHQHAPPYVHPHTVYSHFMQHHQSQPQQVHVVVHQQPSHPGSNFEKGPSTSLTSGPLDDRNAAAPVMQEASTLSSQTRPRSEVHPGQMQAADRVQGQQRSAPPRQPTHAPYNNIESQTMGYAAAANPSSRSAPGRTVGTSLHHGAGAPTSPSLESSDRKAASPNESTPKRDYEQHPQQQQQQMQSRDVVYNQWLEGTPSLSSVEVPTTLSMSSSFGAMNAQAPSFDPGAVPSVVDYAKQQAPASILHPSHQHFHHHQAPYPYYSYVPPDANMMYASQAHSSPYEQDSMYAPNQDRLVQPLGSPSGAASKSAEQRSSPSKAEGGVSSDVSSTGNDRNNAKPMRGNGTPPQTNNREDDKSSRA